MKDKFGTILTVGDFVIYNQCILGKITNTNIVVVRVTKPARVNAFTFISNRQVSNPIAKHGVEVVNQLGRHTTVTNPQKIVRLSGVPPSLIAKFK